MKDYDETTAFLGHWGSFQKIVFFLLCTSTVPNGFSAFSVVFLADTPAHHCKIPDGNLSESWRAASIPVVEVNGQKQQSKCWRYRLDVIRNLSALGYSPQDINLTDIEQERCVDGWTYSKDIYQSTIVTEFDLVCNNEWKQPFTSSVYFIGVLSGSFFSGQLSDRFGRKPVLFLTMLIQSLFTFIQMFSPSWEVFSILFFIVGLGQISNYVAAFVLGTEILVESVRVLYSSLGVCLFFAIGYMLLPLIAFFIRDWRMLLLTMSLPALIYIPLWWFIPESPRWLLSLGRVEEAEAILRDAAKKNKVTAPEVIFKKLEGEEKTSKPEETHNILDLLRTRNIRHTTLILCLVWLTLSMGYFGLSLNTSRLHGDPFLNCFFSAAIEVPAYIISWLSLRYLPRRLSSSLSMLLGGVMLFLIQAVPPNLPGLSVALEMAGKFGIAIGTALMFAYSGELYPTVLRNTAVGFCAMVSRIGSTIAPYFFHLGGNYKHLPHILLGCLCVLSSSTTLFLPESFRKPLPETIQQMQHRDR
ncbi:solute carrier family 22 member 5-like [Chanos chanos]|uniref:Solute carrier family 22 member 5-like n=1 Tax=Chanos chanos TaxID=29144 RepID=A0A6J2X045_CHACN|nr:solute carrier family 22 member 5-like [Chanos chanos]